MKFQNLKKNFLATLILLVLPVISYADLIVCDGPDCTFDDLVRLAIKFMNFLILLAIPLAVISFVFAGFKLIVSTGNESALKEAKSLLTKTAIGMVLVLAAWLLIKVVLIALLANSEGYSLLQLN